MKKSLLIALSGMILFPACQQKKSNTAQEKVVKAEVIKQNSIINQHVGSKSTYAPFQEVNQYTAIPSGFDLVHISHIGRHGARYMTKAKYDYALSEFLTFAQKNNGLTPEGAKLRELNEEVLKAQRGKYARLTPKGKEEQVGIAARMYEQHHDLFNKISTDRPIQASATFKVRTHETREAFLNELFQKVGQDKKIHLNEITYQDGTDSLLRFFDISPSYLEYAEEIEPWKESLTTLIESEKSKKIAQVIASKFVKKDILDELATGKHVFTDIKGEKNIIRSASDIGNCIYEIYQITNTFDPALRDQFKALLSEEHLSWFEFINDYETFYAEGPGYENNDVTSTIAFPLLNAMLANGEDAINHTKKSPVAVFRFAHGETIVPFTTLLGVKKYSESTNNYSANHSWKSFEVNPMSSNIQFLFYKNGKEALVKVLRNEQEVKLDIMAVNDVYYPWKSFRNHYLNVMKDRGLGSSFNSLKEL